MHVWTPPAGSCASGRPGQGPTPARPSSSTAPGRRCSGAVTRTSASSCSRHRTRSPDRRARVAVTPRPTARARHSAGGSAGARWIRRRCQPSPPGRRGYALGGVAGRHGTHGATATAATTWLREVSITVRSHAAVMPLETALSVLAVSTLGLWVLSIAVEDRRIDRRRRAVHAPRARSHHGPRAPCRQRGRRPRRAAARPALTGTAATSRPGSSPCGRGVRDGALFLVCSRRLINAR